jgi:hypothetical protein
LRWPRLTGGTSKPLTFLMQVDCAAVPPAARLGLLPDRGILYFFLDLTWAEPNPFSVLHEEGAANERSAIEPPDDLGPAFGDQAAFIWRWMRTGQELPALLPKWTFDPVAIELPLAVLDPDEYDEGDNPPLLWPGEKRAAEALRSAQGDLFSSPLTIKDFIGGDGVLRRPFANYPHDWRAVQICSGLLLVRVRERRPLPGIRALGALSDAERDALVKQIENEARDWSDYAWSQAPFAAVPQTDSDRFWAWLADKAWLVRFVIGDALTMSIEASLVESEDAAARIPIDVARRVQGRHALASESEHGLFVVTPDRMLAPPVDVQGHQWDRAKTHLLLLELSSNEGLGHHFGEGVYQFWITPENLKARRFDRVELTADAY